MERTQEGRLKRFFRKLRVKYRLVLMNDETFEEKLSFRLSRLNVFVVTGFLAILLVIVTIFIIAYTPLREYIPGYADQRLRKLSVENAELIDSLEFLARVNEQWISNLNNVIDGNLNTQDLIPPDSTTRYDTITITKSPEDSLLRLEMEQLGRYNLVMYSGEQKLENSVSNLFFVPPVKGRITNGFDPRQKHFGIDLAGKDNETVKATLDGMVVFASWTTNTGHVIAIQHPNNLFSIYMHNSALLRSVGDKVNAGEAIAIIGNSGEMSTGPHLHFELWFNGRPVNPREYMNF